MVREYFAEADREQDIPGMGVVCRCCGEKEHKGKL